MNRDFHFDLPDDRYRTPNPVGIQCYCQVLDRRVFPPVAEKSQSRKRSCLHLISQTLSIPQSRLLPKSVSAGWCRFLPLIVCDLPAVVKLEVLLFGGCVDSPHESDTLSSTYKKSSGSQTPKSRSLRQPANSFRSAGILPAVAWATCPDTSGSCPRAGRERVRFQVRFVWDHRTPETGDAPETAGKMPALRT